MTFRTSILIGVLVKGTLGAQTQLATMISVADSRLRSLTEEFLNLLAFTCHREQSPE